MIPVYRPPLIVKKLFNDFIWQTTNNKVLLTFDDGPTEGTTPVILELLNMNRIKAAFFCVGENIQKYHELTNQIINSGHLIANHTMKHKLLTDMSSEETIDEIRSFNDLLKAEFNYDVKYFRPPHGRFNLKTNALLQKQGMKCVMWSLLSRDYENDLKKVKYGIDNFLNANSIIVFHDSIKSNSVIQESLDYTFKVAAKKNLEFGEPEDCLK